MKKSIFFHLLFGCLLLGCISDTNNDILLDTSNGILLWSEQFTHGRYEVRTTQTKLSLISSINERQRINTIDKPNSPVAFLSGETIVIDEPKIQFIDAVVIIDEELANKTAQIEITRQNNNVTKKINKSGHGTLFFIDPQIQQSKKIIDENGNVDAIGSVESSIGIQTIICYRLIDENNNVIYENFRLLPTESVPNCEGISN